MALLDRFLGMMPDPWGNQNDGDPIGLLAQNRFMPQQAMGPQAMAFPQPLPPPQSSPPQLGGVPPMISAQPAQPETPLPPTRPQFGPETGATNFTPQDRSYEAKSANVPERAAPQAEGGGFDFGKISDAIGGIYGKGGPGDPLISMGIGLLGSKNIGSGLQQGLQNMNASQLAQRQIAHQDQQTKFAQAKIDLAKEKANQDLLTRQGNVAAVKQAMPNATPEQIAAIANNPTLMQNVLAELAPKHVQPQLFDVGGKKVWGIPGQTETTPIAGQDVVGGTEGIPAGVDPTTYRKEAAKVAVKNQQQELEASKVAEDVMPQIDRATEAYKKLADLKAIGPASASGFMRTLGGMSGSEAEKARQTYETAAKELELAKARISMKGQGQVTQSERAMLALTLPRLDAADAQTGLDTLNMWHKKYGGMIRGTPETKPTGSVMTGPLEIGGSTKFGDVTITRKR